MMMTEVTTTRTTAAGEVLVPVESKHSAHADMFQTLDLLAIDTDDGPAYFVVEGCAKFCPADELRGHHQYFYEEHSCPVNFIPIPMIMFKGDDDPHGLFRYVDSAWMTEAYVEAKDAGPVEDYLRSVFPALRG